MLYMKSIEFLEKKYIYFKAKYLFESKIGPSVAVSNPRKLPRV